MSCTQSPSAIRLWARLGCRAPLLLGLFLIGIACQKSTPTVQSYLEGQITVAPRIDTSSDYSNFRVLVVRAKGRAIDTLGHATTDPDGRFSMTVSAPERDIYKLTIWGRRGQERLATSNYVVAEGDSGSLKLELPVGRGPLKVRSPENVALLGYQNTMAMHRQMLTKHLKENTYSPDGLVQTVRLTSSVLWSLQDNYAGTYASELAAVESLSLLQGWNDSLVVDRVREIDPSNPRFIEAARIGRKAEARLHGQRAALTFLDTLEARVANSPKRAGVQAVRIQAFLDSAQTDAALSASQRLRADYPDTKWAEWAKRAHYEAGNLMPGMKAPELAVQTLSGDSLSLRRLRGHPVVLEYYQPGNTTYNQQLAARNDLYQTTRTDSVSFVSISTEPDTVVNRAFLSSNQVPGRKVIAPKGLDDPLVTRYNVFEVPTRYLINGDGEIVRQYPGSALLALRLDLTRLLQTEPSAEVESRP